MDIVSIVTVAGPTAVLTGGIAFGAFRSTLRDTERRIKELETSHIDLKGTTTDRLARIETKLDQLLIRPYEH